MIQLSFKSKLAYITPTCILLILILNASLTSATNSIIIDVDSIEWPPDYSIEEDSTYFHISISFNITNLGDTKYITTPHSNLLYPYMIVDLEGFHGEYEGMSGFCMITDHTIDTGVSSSGAIMSFLIHDYINEKVPPGKIILWSDVDSYGHGYDIISPNTTLFVNKKGDISTETNTELVKHNSLLLVNSVFIVLFLYKRKRNKNSAIYLLESKQ